MAEDQQGTPGDHDDQETRPQPVIDPLTFADPMAFEDPREFAEPAAPGRPAPPAGRAPVPGRPPAPGRASTADPAAVTALRHGAVTRSPSGTPPPAVAGAPGAGPEPLGGSRVDRRPGGRPQRQLHVPASLLVACAVLIAAGVVVIGVSRHSPGSGPARPGGSGADRSAQAALQAAATARSQAARWVTRRVSRSAVVACDPEMCAALQSGGLPAADLLVLSTGAGDPMGANVLVTTPNLQHQFGDRLAKVYAPVVLARFGSARDQIDIRVVAPNGSAAYLAALRSDQAARKSAGTELLTNRQIQVSAEARTELTAGEVDARLLLMLPALAAVHPVRVLGFGGTGPRADAGLPRCSAVLAGWAAPTGLNEARYVRWLQDYLGQQRQPYKPQTWTSRAPGGLVVNVEFSQPAPLGLLHAG
jgi:hypothetical protein